MAYKLVLRWPDRREERPLGADPVRLGRDPRNDVVIPSDDRSVSRFHARLDPEAGRWRIVDTRSTNGVRVNGQLIEPGDGGARLLADGDHVQLGVVELELLREEKVTLRAEKDTDRPRTQRTTAVARLQDLPSLIQPPGAVTLTRDAEMVVERARRAVSVVTTIGQRIAALTPLDDIIDAIVDLVFEATNADRAALLLWDADVERLVPKRACTRAGGPAASMAISETVVREAFERRVVVQMDPQVRLSESMTSLGLRSAVGVPLVGESGAIGVIYADSSVMAEAFDDFGLSLLAALATHAAIALEQSRLARKARQEERWREHLERYLPKGVVDGMIAAGEGPLSFGMRAEERDATVLFCDMAGFTSRTEAMEPHDVLLLLNRCFGRMTEVVQDHGGTLDKYIGDCLMAVFGAPLAQPDHARRAALAALGLRDAVRTINADGGQPDLTFRIGMHSGRVIAGDVGHVTRRNWTVLGSTVNLASRMESSVAQPGRIVLTGETRAALGDEFDLRPVELARPPKGISRGFAAFELLGLRA